MSRTSKEIREEIDKLYAELYAAEDAEACEKYAGLEGHWVEFTNTPWHEDEDESCSTRIRTAALITHVYRISPMSSTEDQVYADARFIIEFDPDYYGGIRFVDTADTDTGLDSHPYGSTVDFASNHYKIVGLARVNLLINQTLEAYTMKITVIKQAISGSST